MGSVHSNASWTHEWVLTEGHFDWLGEGRWHLMITDILNSNSEILALGSNTDKVEAAFNFVLDNNHAFLEGAVSRKKQVVPQLTESFNA